MARNRDLVVSHAIIGVELAFLEDEFGGEREAACDHDFDTDDSNFCPYCGVGVKITDGEKFAAFSNIEDFVERLQDKLPRGYVVGRTMYDNRVFVGLGLTSTSSSPVDSMDWPIDDSEIERILRTLLDPYDLYDEATFGFHSVLYSRR